ncbi:uncharacterized protein BX663DRAFT_160194 [Cokeromyces recurvatus]|uniref:uncharacterized protein n=1 Tax=Cokeromyces recurvatus TaxID=90255 RepID=UPI00221EF882|nr:uncharacterized protein BX663DRAFT_160194 [Cokeromyces recurvatus]KAI7900240.1 hypothetical protein BX663DRAFT_160194 [Cokeromyces recurvatus]
MWYSKEYDPIQVGSINGVGIKPHDAAIQRAASSEYRAPKYLKTDPNQTLFIGRLNFNTIESTLKRHFEKYGTIANITIIRNNVTGLSEGYGFITFTTERATREAYRYANKIKIDDHVILVDYERSRVMKNWIPRRLGGGYGGKKESGQLRFGARDRPFRESDSSSIHISSEQRRADNWTQHHSSSSSSTTTSPSLHDSHRRHDSRYYREHSHYRHHHRSRSSSYEDRKDKKRKYSHNSRSPSPFKKKYDNDSHRKSSQRR